MSYLGKIQSHAAMVYGMDQLQGVTEVRSLKFYHVSFTLRPGLQSIRYMPTWIDVKKCPLTQVVFSPSPSPLKETKKN